MIALSGARLVLPDRLSDPALLLIEGDRIAAIHDATSVPAGPYERVPLDGGYVLPGFIDVHVHGLAGIDTLAGDGSVAALAARLPRYGVTAFCPTTVACPPAALARFLAEVGLLLDAPPAGAARVLPAHLESHFIAPAYRGAQPAACLRTAAGCVTAAGRLDPGTGSGGPAFGALDVLRIVERHQREVGIVTLAPEVDGALDLIHWLTARGHRVALGHSGASFDESLAAIRAGARHATHLLNRMAPLDRREPGLAGAVLASPAVAAELVCDGVHVHPAMIRLALAAKGAARLMAITDGTAGAGLAEGAQAMLGDQPITVAGGAARLADGTLAGSIATMDQVVRTLVGDAGLTLVEAATMCATTPARELGLDGRGAIAAGAVADLVVLDPQLAVARTYVAGRLAYAAPGAGSSSARA